MLEFILKYWLEWLMTTIIAGLGFACRKFYKLYKSEKKHEKEDEREEFSDNLKDLIKECTRVSKEEDEKLQEQINAIKVGVLSLQGRNFKQDCRILLAEDHTITLEEFENLQEEHSAYKSLGGNHDGDELFEMARKKAMNDIAK